MTTEEEFAEQFRRMQRVVYDECRESKWDPDDKNSFAEEIAHLHAELSEAFEAWRMDEDVEIRHEFSGKPTGVPIEFADVLIGLLYNAQRMGFDLWAALEHKRDWNRSRNYVEEGRQLHA